MGALGVRAMAKGLAQVSYGAAGTAIGNMPGNSATLSPSTRDTIQRARLEGANVATASGPESSKALLVLVALEVLALASLRRAFRHYHGG